MDAAEIEFLAENTPITIIPNFKEGVLYLISGDIGPFSPGIPIEVPLWLAINLFQRGKCRIIMPEWLSEEKLTEKKEEEAQSKLFTEMPSEHYLIIAQMLLSTDPGSIPNAQQVRTLLKDMWDLRISKLRSSVSEFIVSDASHAKLDRLTPLEINSIRPILPHGLDQRYRIAKSARTSEFSQTLD